MFEESLEDDRMVVDANLDIIYTHTLRVAYRRNVASH